MAAVTRQPFAPLDGARLQTLTSMKNRQNALPSSSPGKRKAFDSLDTDNSENVDPQLFSKRSKASSDGLFSKDSFVKPSTFILTKSTGAGDVSATSSTKTTFTPRPRSVLNPKSPTKLNTSITKSTPLSAPAGRSPTRGKRSGILSSRRRTAAFSRVDPPSFGLSSKSSTPFSLDAALKGTIPSYASRNASSAAKPSSKASLNLSSLHESEMMKSSWFFDIHEDTPEQEMTNLLQHSTCVLDISSDEESETRRQRERAEGKENVPPADDISQTSRLRIAARKASEDEMVFEKERKPLGEMDAREYYSEGCDENSIVIVPGDEDEDQDRQAGNGRESAPVLKFAQDGAPEPSIDDGSKTVEELMQNTDEPAPGAAVLEPIEGTGESFEVWESGSAKDEAETATVEVLAEC
ncbi:hypothetical protein AAE478_004476 [Parahypoxylon ruwenzoriense]